MNELEMKNGAHITVWYNITINEQWITKCIQNTYQGTPLGTSPQLLENLLKHNVSIGGGYYLRGIKKTKSHTYQVDGNFF